MFVQMFGSGFTNPFASEAPTGSDDGQRINTRRTGNATGLFAVPEDREVLRTPEENQNSGFVFGQGTESTENDGQLRTNQHSTDRPSATTPCPILTTLDQQCDVPEESITLNGYLSPTRRVTARSRDDQPMQSPTVSSSSAGSVSSPPARSAGLLVRTVFNEETTSPARLEAQQLKPPPIESSIVPVANPEMSRPQPTVVPPPPPNLSLLAASQGDSSYASAVPNLRKIVELEREMDEMKAQRERIAAERVPESHSNLLMHRDKVQMLRHQMSYEETKFEVPPKSWLEQIKEEKDRAARQSEMYLNALKRTREETHEDIILLSDEETARREAALQNTARLRQEALEAYEREHGYPPLDQKELEKRLPHAFVSNDYYMQPNREEMCQMLSECGLDVLRAVKNVRFGRKGYGEVHFEGPMNLEQLDFEAEIEIKHGHLLIKDVQKISNLPATVTLYHVKILAQLEGAKEETKKALQMICDAPGRKLVSFDRQGTWVFKVDRFEKE